MDEMMACYTTMKPCSQHVCASSTPILPVRTVSTCETFTAACEEAMAVNPFRLEDGTSIQKETSAQAGLFEVTIPSDAAEDTSRLSLASPWQAPPWAFSLITLAATLGPRLSQVKVSFLQRVSLTMTRGSQASPHRRHRPSLPFNESSVLLALDADLADIIFS